MTSRSHEWNQLKQTETNSLFIQSSYLPYVTLDSVDDTINYMMDFEDEDNDDDDDEVDKMAKKHLIVIIHTHTHTHNSKLIGITNTIGKYVYQT